MRTSPTTNLYTRFCIESESEHMEKGIDVERGSDVFGLRSCFVPRTKPKSQASFCHCLLLASLCPLKRLAHSLPHLIINDARHTPSISLSLSLSMSACLLPPMVAVLCPISRSIDGSIYLSVYLAIYLYLVSISI